MRQSFAERIELLRELVARYWRPLLSLGAGILTALNGLKAFNFNVPVRAPVVTGDYWLIGVGIFLFIIIRFPRVAVFVTRILLGPPKPLTNPPRLFRGPRSYGRNDSLPGRQRESGDCWDRIREATFFILEGESGCGKSSLLNAALVSQAQTAFRVIECRVADDPFGKLHAALRNKPYRPSEHETDPQNLVQALAHSAPPLSAEGHEQPSQPLILCIDQCEELFVTVRDDIRQHFLTVLKEAIQLGQIRLLIVIRSDFRDLLDRLCRTVDPEQQAFDLGNYYPLNALRADQAETILDEILQPVSGNDPLMRQQLRDFARALVLELLRPPRDKRLFQGDEKTVLPVELQIIGSMIESKGPGYFSATALRNDLGGKMGLLKMYIDEAKDYAWHKSTVPGDQTLLILMKLISPAKTKWPQTAAQVAQSLSSKIPLNQIEQVLDAFADKYLVNQLPSEDNTEDDAQRYELMHEHLIQILAEAPDPLLQRAQDAEERLRFWLSRTQVVPTNDNSRPSLANRVGTWFAKPVPFVENLRLWRFARSIDERRLLLRNLRGFCLRAIVLALVLLPGALWGYQHIQQLARKAGNMGHLQIHNPHGATLELTLIHHYGELASQLQPVDTPITVGTQAYLAGPADYMLTASTKGLKEPARYPVYIHGYTHHLALTVDKPPENEKIRKMKMKFIPGGVFRMGDKYTKGDGGSNNQPAHDVVVDGFFIDQYEVTNKRYKKFIEAGGYNKSEYWTDKGWRNIQNLDPKQPAQWNDERFNKPEHPVVGVSWYEADAYCRWQNEEGARHTPAHPCPPAERSCLPTEAEWEKAAAGPQGFKWALKNGNVFDRSKVNTFGPDDDHERTAPVESYDPNGYGLYNMSGNAWEWVADWYDESFYKSPEASARNSVNNKEGSGHRVVRGGGWDDYAEFLRVAFRDSFGPDIRYLNLGFRCVLRPPRG